MYEWYGYSKHTTLNDDDHFESINLYRDQFLKSYLVSELIYFDILNNLHISRTTNMSKKVFYL